VRVNTPAGTNRILSIVSAARSPRSHFARHEPVSFTGLQRRRVEAGSRPLGEKRQMKVLTRNELAVMLIWAFRDERVESAINPHVDATTLYCNVMALPVAEAATVVAHARSGNVPPADPVALAR